jgi:hypothetical protein
MKSVKSDRNVQFALLRKLKLLAMEENNSANARSRRKMLMKDKSSKQKKTVTGLYTLEGLLFLM